MDAIAAILSRTSVRHFRPEPVPPEVVGRLLECAVRAPNHKLTEPWRFIVLTGEARDKFAEIRAQHRLKRFDNPFSPEALAAADKVRREARETPAYVVVASVLSADELTREEDYAATMMAIGNLIVAAQALGLGSFIRTGGVMKQPALLELTQVPQNERIVAVISLGYPSGTEAPRRRKPWSEVTRWIDH
jgi:nitroreductase